MIPILFEKNQKFFTHQGLGPLKETTKCEVFEKKNGEFTLELAYPRNGSMVKKLKLRRIILAKPNGRDEPHAFRIFDIDMDSSDSEIIVHATTITNDLAQNVVKLAKVFQSDAQGALSILKNNLVYPTHFSLRSNIQLVKSTEWEHRNPLNAIVGEEGSIVHLWGGEIKRENDTIWVYSRRGRDNVTMIRLEKNIKGLQITESFEDRYTSILPYSDWEEEVVDNSAALNNQNEGSTYSGERISRRTYGNIVYSKYHDPEVPVIRLVQFQPPNREDPPYNTPEKINQVAANYFTHKNPGADIPKYEVRANLLQLSESSLYDDRFKVLEQVNLWDTVDAYIPEWDINRELMITSIKYDSLRERTISIEAHSLGRTGTSSLTDDMSKQYTDMSKKFKEMEQQLAEHKNGIFNIIMDSANGRNKIFSGRSEPPTDGSKEGDVWFKEVEEGKIEIWIFDGHNWIKKASEDIGEQLEQEIANLRAEIESRMNASDVARQADIDDIRRTAGLAQTTAEQASMDSWNAQTMANQAVSKAAQAIHEAQSKSQQVLADATKLINDNKTALQNQIRTVVESTDTKIDTVKGELTKYAQKTVVDGISGRIDSQARQITDAINLASSKMDRTQVDNLIGSKGYATTTAVNSLIQQKENSILTEVSKIESKIPRTIGSVNLFLNSDFSKTYTYTSFTVAGRTLNTYGSEWSGYNPGVSSSPQTVYHAYLDNIFDRTNVYVFNESDGTTHWKGIQQDITSRFVKLTEDKFTFSLDVYAKKEGLRLFGGLYYHSSDGSLGFKAGHFAITPTILNKWHRVSVSVPFDRTKYDPNRYIRFYLYGYGWSNHNENSIVAVDKLQLEIGDVATAHHKAPEEIESLIGSLTTRVEQTERGWQATNTNITNIQGTLATHTTTLANIDGTIRTQANRVVLEELAKTSPGTIGAKVTDIMANMGYITDGRAQAIASTIYDSKVVQTEKGIETKIVEMKSLISRNLEGRNYAVGTYNPRTFTDTSKTTGNVSGSTRYLVHHLYSTYQGKTLREMGFSIGDMYAVAFDISKGNISNDEFRSYGIESYKGAVGSGGYVNTMYHHGTQNVITDFDTKYFGTFKITSESHLDVNQWKMRVDLSNRQIIISNFRMFRIGSAFVAGNPNHKDSPPKQPWQPAWEDFITETKFSETKDTVDMYRRVLGSTNENGVVNKINELVMTNAGTIQTIADYSNMSDNLIVDSQWLRKWYNFRSDGLTFARKQISSYKDENNNFPRYGFVHYDFTGTSNWHRTIIPIYPHKLNKGETYTLTFEYIMQRATKGLRIGVASMPENKAGNSYYLFPERVVNGWTSISHTFTLTESFETRDLGSGLWIALDPTTTGGKFEIRNMALRRGAKTLPYSPNPDDDHYIQTGEIKSEQQATRTEVTNLAGSYAIRNLTSSGTVLNQLNLNKDGSVKIDGKLVQITGQTYIENGVITNAMINSLDVSKVTGMDATFLQARIGTLDVSKITGDTAKFVRANMETAIVELLKGKTILAKDNSMAINLTSGNITFNTGGSIVFNSSNNYLAYASGSSVAFIQPTHRKYTNHAALALGVNSAKSAWGGNLNLIDSNDTTGYFAGIKIFRDFTTSSNYADSIEMVGDTISFGHTFNSSGDTEGWIMVNSHSGVAPILRATGKNNWDRANSKLYVGDVNLYLNNGQWLSLKDCLKVLGITNIME